jgi:hypothetical protein
MVRKLFILFLIVLLPLRGWAGEVMGIRMAAVASASQQEGAMPPDCPMHVHAGAHSDAADADARVNGEQPAQGAPQGSPCDLCIPMAAMAAGAPFDIVAISSHAQPLAGSASFVSALMPQAVKPPIF